MSNVFQSDNDVFLDDSQKISPTLKVLENPEQEKLERKLVNQIKTDKLHMDRLAHPDNQNVIMTDDFKNLQLLTSDDEDLISEFIPKNKKKKKKERRLHLLNRNIYLKPKKKKKRHVIEGLNDLGIYDISSFKKHHSSYRNIPVRILSQHRKISLKNSFNEKAIKSLIKKKHSKKNRKLAPDMDTFASPLVMFQRVPAVPNRMGHSILMNLNKMFGGKLNIKIPPQPPVVMVNQTPYYSTI
jgi:hypothetical protein